MEMEAKLEEMGASASSSQERKSKVQNLTKEVGSFHRLLEKKGRELTASERMAIDIFVAGQNAEEGDPFDLHLERL